MKEISKYDVIYHRYLGRLIELFPIHEGASGTLTDALIKIAHNRWKSNCNCS